MHIVRVREVNFSSSRLSRVTELKFAEHQEMHDCEL